MKLLARTAMALLLLTSACDGTGTADSAAAANTAGDAHVTLQIRTAAGQSHSFAVELAVDDLSQQRGLMGRPSLADDRGMLFPFPVPRTASFWMKDTPLALDLLFIRPNGTIAAILPGHPHDLHPISAGEPVSAVLEIRQGRAQALGLAPGDRVQWGDCDGGATTSTEPWRPDRFCPNEPG